MSKEPQTDPCYINVLQRRKLHHAEKREECRNAWWDAWWDVKGDEPATKLLLEGRYHKGYEDALTEIIEELIAPDESEEQS